VGDIGFNARAGTVVGLLGADVESYFLEDGEMTDEDKRELAFPGTDARGFVATGMTLRDWFAGQAMAAIVGNDYTQPFSVLSNRVAERAYEVADEMMEARKK